MALFLKLGHCVHETPSTCGVILVIEDDEAILFALQQALEMEGYEVLTAANGKKGLELLRLIGAVKRPCLILLDLMLPVMNGWEFLEEIKKENKALAEIPIVITSAAGSSAALTATKQAQGYIKKPIDIELLFTTVRKFCGPSVGLP